MELVKCGKIILYCLFLQLTEMSLGKLEPYTTIAKSFPRPKTLKKTDHTFVEKQTKTDFWSLNTDQNPFFIIDLNLNKGIFCKKNA